MNRTRSNPEQILVRCDGTVETGLGHVSRCLALAEALAELEIATCFFGRFEAGAEDLLVATGMTFELTSGEIGSAEDLQSTIEAVRRTGADGVVLDSYRVNDDYVTTLDHDGAPLLLIDDFARLRRYQCSAVLNFTVNAAHMLYPFRTQLWFLGPHYLLARRRLRLARRIARPRSGDVHRVLVAMGGVDPLDLSRLVVRALWDAAPHLTVRAVVGRSYPFPTDLASLVAGFAGSSAVVSQIEDLAIELAEADFCVCGGGLTKYEAAYLGVPTAVLSQTREQAEETVHFAARGLAKDLGLGTKQTAAPLASRLSSLIADAQFREALSRAALACFPEDPTQRAAAAFAESDERIVVIPDSTLWNRWNEGGGPKYPHEKVIQFCFRNYPPDQRSKTRTLDVGCGSGVHTVFLASEGFRVTATDISDVGVANTKRAIEARGLDAALRVEGADVLDFPPDSFDLVIGVSVYDSTGPAVAKASVARLRETLVRGGRGFFLFASDRDFRIQQANQLGLHGFTRAEVDEIFMRGFTEVCVDRYITTYQNQRYEQNDWLITLVR